MKRDKPHPNLFIEKGSSVKKSREYILEKVKAQLGEVDHNSARERLSNPKGFKPSTSNFGDVPLGDIFFTRVKKSYATIERVGTMNEASLTISKYLQDKDVGCEVVVPWKKGLEDLNYDSLIHRQVQSGDTCVLTSCELAVAETGTLLAHSSANLNISSLYLADHHIIIVRPEQLIAGLEDIWPHYRGLAQKSNQGLPRSINWLTGPSMSADIEKKLTLGVHGPISMHIILLG